MGLEDLTNCHWKHEVQLKIGGGQLWSSYNIRRNLHDYRKTARPHEAK